MNDSVTVLASIPEETLIKTSKDVQDILSLAIMHSTEHTAVVISDAECLLAVTLTEAYRRCLPTARFIDFESTSPADIFAIFNGLKALDLVVLIQSTSFRLKDFRIRVELFAQSLKVIEHPHLARMKGIQQEYYLESLAYDPHYYRGLGHALKSLIDKAGSAMIDSGGEYLYFSEPLEEAKLNVGDYSAMKNIGGQFPIGEVFTEARRLESVHGRVRIFAFADSTYSVNVPDKPITLVITAGRVSDVIDTTDEFEKVLAAIRHDEGEVWLRELGFGMNRAFTNKRIVNDIGTYERMCGIHLSLGSKHGVYKKVNFRREDTWHHLDVFAISHLVYLDDTVVFENGAWKV